MLEPFLPFCLLLAVLLCASIRSGEPALVISLEEPERITIPMATKPNQTRTLHLVTNRTYYLSCKDTSPNGMFDISSNNIWHHNGSPVQKLFSSFPPADQPAVFSSTNVYRFISNEWTLVIQKVGVANTGVGLFSCRGLNGELESFDIRETSHTVIAGDPDIFVVAGTGDQVVSLTPFISPPPSAVQWLYNGNPAPQAFPEGVSQHQFEVLFSRTITSAMSGNYTCVATFEGGVATVSDSYIVVVRVAPNGELWPPSSTISSIFNDTRFTVSCMDRTGVPLSHSITWNRNGIPLVSDSRVSMSFLSNSSVALSTLAIDPIRSEDVGDYSCRTLNLAGSTQVSFSVTNILVTSKLEHNIVYQEGSTITLQIHVPGSSSSSTSETLRQKWRRNGQDLSDDNKYSARRSPLPDGASIYALDVSAAIGEDSGIYSCELSNGISTKVVTFDYVGVVSVAVSSYVNVPSGDAVKAGNNISLHCRAEFTNIPSLYEALEVTISWGRPNNLSLANHAIISDSMVSGSSGHFRRTYESNLMFSPALQGDGGGYECTVSYVIAAGGEVKVRRHESSLDIDSVLFQLRLLGVTSSCQDWKSSDSELKLNSITNATLLHVNQVCPDCALTSTHLTSAGFYCFPESPQAVTYRAKLHGTISASSSMLLAQVLAWTKKDGILQLGGVEASLDTSCPLEISSTDSAECMVEGSTMLVPEAGVSMVIVIGVGVAASVVLLMIVALIISLVLCGIWRRRHGTGTLETKEKHTPSSNGHIKAVNPGLKGEEVEYEDLDKFAVSDTILDIPFPTHVNGVPLPSHVYGIPGPSHIHNNPGPSLIHDDPGPSHVPSAPGSSHIHVSSTKVPGNNVCQQNHLTYDYAAM